MMTKLDQLFIQLDNDPSLCIGLTSGRVLEEKIEYLLSKLGFNDLTEEYNTLKKEERGKFNKCQNFIKLKAKLKNKDNAKRITLEQWMPVVKNNSFISQPLGSTASPDIIVIENNNIIKIEIKSSSRPDINVNPSWNSIPMENVIYIYGINHKGITYFMGEDILAPKIAKMFNDFYKNHLDVELLFQKYLDNKGVKGYKNMLGFTPELINKVREKKRNAIDKGQGYFSEPWCENRKGKVKNWVKAYIGGHKYDK